MVKSIELKLFTEEYINRVEEWFEDEEINKRLGGMLPLGDFFQYVKKNPNDYVWIALHDEQLIGLVMVEVEEDTTGNIALIVEPSMKNKGYGKAIIKKTMNLREMERIQKWVASIEEDNIASLKCYQGVGYSHASEEPDEDGFYELTFLVDKY